MTSHQVKVGVYNPSTGKTIYLNAGDPNRPLLHQYRLVTGRKSIYLIELNRDQNHAVLCQYDATTGKLLGKLLEKTHPKYEASAPHRILTVGQQPNSSIRASVTDITIYIYATSPPASKANGKAMPQAASIEYIPTKQLTEGKWLVGDILGFNARGKKSSSRSRWHRLNNFAVNVNTGKRSLPFSFRSITEGEHNGMLSASGSYLIDRYSTPTLPRHVTSWTPKA